VDISVSRISIKSVGRSLWLTMRLIRLARDREEGGKSKKAREREREKERKRERERERERESSPYLSCPDTCKASTEMVPTRCAYTTYLGIYVLQVGLVCVGSWSDDQGWNLPQLRSICQHGRPEYH